MNLHAPYLRAASKEPWRIPNADLAEARLLQRKGLLFSEIAEHLELPRAAVVRSLYWDQMPS